MAGIEWNPHYPGEIGNEHVDAGQRVVSISKPNFFSGALTFRSRQTGSVSGVDLFADNGASAPALDVRYGSLARPMYAEIVPAGSEPMVVSVDTFNPPAVTGSGMVNENLTTPVTVSRLTTNDDGLYIAAPAINDYIDVQFDTAAFPLDRHVLGIIVMSHVNITYRLSRGDPGFPPTTQGHQWYKDIPTLAPRTVQSEVQTGEVKLDQGGSAWSHWTAQQIRDFRSSATGGTRYWRVRCRAGPGAWRIDEMKMLVIWTPERRTAVGIGSPTTSFAWTRFALATPTAVGSPSLVNGSDYTLMVRRIVPYSVDNVDTAVLPWRHLRGFPQDPNWKSRDVTQNGLAIIGLSDPVEGIATAKMVTGSAFTSDSQPYSYSRNARVWGTDQTYQTITVTGAATAVTYGQAYVTAGWNPANGQPEGPLRCEVVRASDGTRVFSPVETSAADVERLPVESPSNDVDDQSTQYKVIQFRFPESTVLAAGTYRILLSAGTTTEARAWRVGALVASAIGSPDQTWSVAGISGGSNAATGTWVSGTTKLPLTGSTYSSDLMATLAAVPAAITGVGAAIGTITAHHAEVCTKTGGCNGCADQTSPFVSLTWSPTPTGTPDVAGYEIDRMDTLSPDWERVAFIDGRSTVDWGDHEARIGVASSYRVRAVLSSGVTGDWSAVIAATQPTGQIALSFTSNAATGMGVTYPEVWTSKEIEREFAFTEFQDVSLATIYARNRPIALRPIERQGVAFSRTVLLNAGCSVALPTLDLFRPLRDLAWAPIPYVCVRDGEGNRWFASLTVPTGSNVRPGERWLADIGVTEVQDSPSIVNTGDEQVTGPVTLGSAS